MKTNYLCVVLTIVVWGCTTKLEVPGGKVAVTFNSETGEVNKEVLIEGHHDVNLNTVAVFYDLKPSQIDFSFDFLYKDVSEGQIQFSIKFTPRVDSLSRLYKEHGGEALPVVVQLGIRSEVRDLMSTFSSKNIDSKIIFETIKDNLNSKSELNRFIEIKEFVPGGIKVTQPNK